ncbi:MAG: glycerophosphodiester phosphodiesterase family protein [Gammaproteobacteria bacterium]|nr:glycerophosphodiester phosphodiesterase family protein [Gammaproteobacteria bacterium]
MVGWVRHCGFVVGVLCSGMLGAADGRRDDDCQRHAQAERADIAQPGETRVQLGPRPYFLVGDMARSRLKRRLERCAGGPFRPTDFSIGHRGAPRQFPEHTEESYRAAARMGAGIVECDVTFTRDRELVCRHSQCDLHTTTNILLTSLAAKCSVPFEPADPATDTPASVKCCTSDLTLDEFKSLKGKRDGADALATTVEAYVAGTTDPPTDGYPDTDETGGHGTLLSHKESIALFRELGVKMAPELKSPGVAMPFQGSYTQQDYARQMIEEYRSAGVAPRDVWAQSFSLADVEYWIANAPCFGRQAVYLDASYERDDFAAFMGSEAMLRDYMADLVRRGVPIVAPPMWMLLTTDDGGRIVPSQYAHAARRAGLDIVTWTIERTDLTDGATGDWYFGSALPEASLEGVIDRPGDRYLVLDVLAREVGIVGIFSDWPATVTYFANCMGLR